MPFFSQSQNLATRQTQEHQLGQKQILGLKFLEANALELRTAIAQAVTQNPLLEFTAPPPQELLLDDLGAPDSDTTTTDANDNQNDEAPDYADENGANDDKDNQDDFAPFESEDEIYTQDRETEERRKYLFDSITETKNLRDSLMEQLAGIPGTERSLELTQGIVDSLDENGLLRETDQELADILQADTDEIAKAIAIVQTLDPAGIGARNIQECLLLQIARKGQREGLDWKIVSSCFDLLSRNKLPEIAKKLQVPQGEVNAAVERIKQLNLQPGLDENSAAAQTIIPDAFVAKNAQGQWTVKTNDEIIPQIVLVQDYLDMLHDNRTDSSTRKYLENKEKEAQELLSSIDRRQSTLFNLTTLLLQLQNDYFESNGDTLKLKPLLMKNLAELLSCEESTVTRAVKYKHLMTPFGLVPYSSFFTSSSVQSSQGGEDVTGLAVRKKIVEIIAAEDKKHPISDQKIAEILQQQGLDIARRTVAKYRELENIPATSLRKEH